LIFGAVWPIISRMADARGTILAVFLAALALSGCSALGLTCGPRPQASQDEQVAWERCRANGGDKEAQYELGRRYWRGDGVPHDREAAITWLEKAATPIDSSRSYVYVPPVGHQNHGGVQGFDMPGEPGNGKAILLLERIRQTPAETGR
jgi:TPR repeat protein